MTEFKSLEDYQIEESVQKIESLSEVLQSYNTRKIEYLEKMQQHLAKLKQLSASLKG